MRIAARPDVRQSREKQILDAAARVFSRKGFGGTRMDDIVRESGLSKGLLYWYFRSKDDLIAAILRRLFEPERRRIRALPGREGSARERLTALGQDIVRDMAAFSRFLPITFEFYSLAFRNRGVGKVLKGFFADYVESVQEVIAQGIRDGELEVASAREAALAYGAVVEGSVLLWVFDRDMVDLTRQLRAGVDLILRGMEKGHRTRADR